MHSAIIISYFVYLGILSYILACLSVREVEKRRGTVLCVNCPIVWP
jgi:hypothetical protein